MSARRHLAMGLAACAGWVLPCAADEQEPGWMVRVDVQMVRISPQYALDLVPRLRDQRTREAAVAKLQSMIAKKEATLLAWPVVWTPSGQIGTAATAEENWYPTWPGTPAGMPQSMVDYVPPPRIFSLQPFFSPFRGGVPSAFETRLTGPMIEVEPTVAGDGQSIEVNAKLQYVRFARMARFVDGKFPGGIENHTERAEFVVAHTVSQFSVPKNQSVLAGFWHFPGKEPHAVLFILRTTARRTTPPSP